MNAARVRGATHATKTAAATAAIPTDRVPLRGIIRAHSSCVPVGRPISRSSREDIWFTRRDGTISPMEAGHSPGWRRDDHVQRIDDQVFDVVVIGGGVVGCGTALDAVTRGLSVALIERDDFASATSSRSTKLLHGGVRYLPQLRFGLIREGLHEQRTLGRLADYLVAPVDFVIPVYRNRGFADAPRWARHARIFPIAMSLGLWWYDRLGAWRGGAGGERRIDADKVLRRFPRLRPDGLRHALMYRDARTDDARLTIMLARTAVDHGAATAGFLEATTVVRHDGGYLVNLVDRIDGTRRAVRCRAVVAATGPFAPPPGVTPDHVPVLLSKGTHMITAQQHIGVAECALMLPETEDGRVIFLVPWLDHAIVGTTDTPFDGDPAHPLPTSDDVAYLTRHLEEYLDVGLIEPISVWSGLRALAGAKVGSTARASREHKVAVLAPGYVQVAGGKLTGYRKIAQRVTDRIAKHLRVAGKSRTGDVALSGSGIAGIESDEAAITIADVTLRRTRIAWLTRDHGRDDAERIAAVMAAELEWDADRTVRELARFEEDLKVEAL